MTDEACGLPNWRKFSRARKTALLLVLAYIAITLASQIAQARHAVAFSAGFRLAEQFVFIAIIVLVAYAIRQADEFIRRMHIEAATVAFVVAALFMPVFAILQQTTAFRPTLGSSEMVLYLPWAATMVFGWWKYR